MYTVEGIGFQRTGLQFVILPVECGVAVCYICCICAALIIGGVTLVILLHLETIVEVEHIHTCYVATVTAQSVGFHCGSLIYKRKHLAYLHIGSEGGLSVARSQGFVAPALLDFLVTRLHITEYLYIIERIAHFGYADLTGLHLDCRVELDKTAKH